MVRFSSYLLLILGVGVYCAAAQDLGSSNNIFKVTTTKGTSTKTHRPAPKPKTVKPKSTNTAVKTSPAANKTPKKASGTAEITGTKSFSKASSDKTPYKGRFGQFASPPSAKKAPGLAGASSDDIYEEFLDLGNAAREERNYSGAAISYGRARDLKPSDSRAIYGLANLYSDQQLWEEAEKSYREALALDPKSDVAYVALSYVLTQPLSAPNLSERYEEAERLARKAIQLAPLNALAYDQLGAALELRGMIGAETERAYRKAIELDPSFAPAYAHLGRLLRRRGRVVESADAYQDAIRRSADVATKVLVADVMQSEQRYSESEQMLRSALAFDPKNPSALLMLGRALTAKGAFIEAESVLKKSLSVTPNGFMANSLLASLYSRQGKLEMAENALLQALRFVPSYEKRRLAQQFESVGDAYMKAGKRRNAERVYKQAISLDSEIETLSGKLARSQQG